MTDDERIASLNLSHIELYFLADRDFLGTPWHWEASPEIWAFIQRLLARGVLVLCAHHPRAYELAPAYQDLEPALKELAKAVLAHRG